MFPDRMKLEWIRQYKLRQSSLVCISFNKSCDCRRAKAHPTSRRGIGTKHGCIPWDKEPRNTKTISVDTIISIFILHANYLFIHCETLCIVRGLVRSLEFLTGTTIIKYMSSVATLKYNSGWKIIKWNMDVVQIKMIHLIPPSQNRHHKLYFWRSFQAMDFSGLLRGTFCFSFEGNYLYLVSPQPHVKGEERLQVEGLNHKVQS